MVRSQFEQDELFYLTQVIQNTENFPSLINIIPKQLVGGSRPGKCLLVCIISPKALEIPGGSRRQGSLPVSSYALWILYSAKGIYQAKVVSGHLCQQWADCLMYVSCRLVVRSSIAQTMRPLRTLSFKSAIKWALSSIFNLSSLFSSLWYGFQSWAPQTKLHFLKR